MASNTKLEGSQKALRAILRKEAKMYDRMIANNGVTTLVYRNCGHCVQFAMAVASPEESQFRRKVGEFYALCRFEDGEVVSMLRGDFENLFHMLGMIEQ